MPMSEFFVSARLTTRSGGVDFTGDAALRIDDLGYTTCRGFNGEYGVTVRWASGVAAVDTPIMLSQDVSIKTEAPGMPGVLVDDFFTGELRFSEVDTKFEGTFRADPKADGEERAVVEVSSGEFSCSVEETPAGEEG